MEKILALVLVAVYSLWLFTAQSIEYTNKTEIITLIAQHHEVNVDRSQKSMLLDIKKACESAGWIMTEFKSNTLIAEKLIENSAVSATVTFTKSSFNVSPQNIDLEGIINKALNI